MRTFCLLLLCGISIFKATGQPGNLDSSFGNNGIQTTGFFTNLNHLSEQGRAVLTNINRDIFFVVQAGSFTRIIRYLPDGRLDSSYGNAGYSNSANMISSGAALQGDKIIVAGSIGLDNSDFALARFTSDGMLDPSFGENGRTTTDFDSSYDQATSLVLQGDKIILAGFSDGYFALARYTANGDLDASFGKNGKVITDFISSSEERIYSVNLQGEKIIVAGYTYNSADGNSDLAIARYTTEGVLDSSFGENGKVTTDFNSQSDIAYSIALQRDNILVAGSNNGDFLLVRYTAEGVLDSSFAENGRVTTDFNNSYDYANSIKLQGDKIILAGYTGLDNGDFALARYTADGILDTSFGQMGKTTTDINNSQQVANSMALQGDMIIVAGSTKSENIDFALARYTADGRLDSHFGENGRATIDFMYGSEDGASSIALQGDKIILAGYAIRLGESNYNFALARCKIDGTLDSSFGVNGKVITDFNAYYGGANSIALQDNKIIVAGSTYNNNNYDFTLVRYSADGALDSSFGEKGIILTDFNGSNDLANSIVLQGDKIIVTGSSNDDFALARYTANGKLDVSFGVDGKVTTDFNNSGDQASSIVLQGDKIIAAGSSNNDFALAGYTADGKLDVSFGVSGKLTTDFNNFDDRANTIALQGDKIIVVGTSSSSFNISDFALARYTANGRLDSSFGVNGKLTTDFNSSYDDATSTALQGDNIIVAGSSNNDFALARYTANGKLDSTFGLNGKVTTDFNSTLDVAKSIALQKNKIIVAGSTYNPYNSNKDFALTRYTSNGALDDSFGESGPLTGHLPSSQVFFTSTAVQGNKIIAAGHAINDYNNNDFALARYTADGKLDTFFGENGRVITDFNNSNDYVSSITLQGDKILVAGYTNNSHGFSDFALARYTADGRLDSTFGVNGKVTTDFRGNDDHANSIVLQEEKILLAGYTNNSHGYSDFALARYTADGTLDAYFGKNGKVITDIGSSNDIATSIAIQGDNIIVAGSSNNDFALARYTTDGKLDATFGLNGKMTTDFNNAFDFANSMAIQGDKIIVVGKAGNFNMRSDDFALASYKPNGILDSSFGVNGKVTTDFNSSGDQATSIALQKDKIIVAGLTRDNNSNTNFALTRYTTEGVLDSSFGVDGKVTTNLDGNSSVQDVAFHENRLYAVGSIITNFYPNESYGAIAAYQLETPEPSISLSIADVTVPESKKFADVTVRLSAPANKWVRVSYTTRNKTALSPQDYLPVKGTLLFAPGKTTAKVYIPIVDDNDCEVTEQFKVLLTNARNATLKDSVGIVTILDDDSAIITKLAASLHINASPNPSDGAFAIQLLGSNLKQQVSVRVYEMSGKLLEARENLNIGQSIHIGEKYKAGTYIIEAVQGNRMVQTKVIKTGK